MSFFPSSFLGSFHSVFLFRHVKTARRPKKAWKTKPLCYVAILSQNTLEYLNNLRVQTDEAFQLLLCPNMS